MNQPILQINKINKSYQNKLILGDLSLQLEAGQILGLVGRNGVGKTTLLESIMGLREIESGQINIWQKKMLELSLEKREHIGFVQQDDIGFDWMRVGQYLDYFGGFYSDWDRRYSRQLMSRWQLDEKKRIADLSGGQKQILQVAQALSIRPHLLILDEPVAHLDPNMRRQFLSELIELTCDIGTSVLFSIHIISDLERVASHIALLNEGKIQHHYELETLKANAASLLFKGDVADRTRFQNLINWQSISTGCKAIAASPNGPSISEIAQQLNITIESQPLTLEDWYLEVTNENHF